MSDFGYDSKLTGYRTKADGSIINTADAFLPLVNALTAHRAATLAEAAVMEGYLYTGAIPVTPLVTAGLTIKSTFATPADKTVAFLPIEVTALTGDLLITLYEGSSGVSGGTAYPATNRNRQSTNASTSVITLAPTVTSNGTAIGLFSLMHTTVPISKSLAPAPLALKKGTTYTLTIQNTSSAANAVSAEMSFIEL